MAHPVPPQIAGSLERLTDAFSALGGKAVDVLKTPWTDVEKSVIKILGGAFDLSKPEHQAVALGLAGMFAARLIEEHQAFWFPNRDAPEAASLGFPDALVMLSPFGAVAESLGRAKLSQLDDVTQEIRRGLAQAKFSPTSPASAVRLTPLEYQRLFDPAFVQFTLVDLGRANATWEAKPSAVSSDLRSALGRLTQVPPEARQQFEGQVLTALSQMDPNQPISSQLGASVQIAELLGHLFGTVEGTSFAPEEFWAEIALPLLFIGEPKTFPPVDSAELDAFTRGVDPLALFVEVVPHQYPSEEGGLLNAFPLTDIGLPHPAFEQAQSLRMMKLSPDVIASALGSFDAAKTKEALTRFKAYLQEKGGKAPPANPEGEQMLDAALSLLTSLKHLVQGAQTGKGELCLRRVTEAEGASEGMLAQVREALKGPRIVLA